MPLLGWRKRQVGTALHNQLITADAAETMLCATLAATTLAGLALFRRLRLVVGRPGRCAGRRLLRGPGRPRSLAWGTGLR